MTLIELATQLNCSTVKAEEVLAANSLTLSDIDETFIPSLKAEMDKSALSTGVSNTSAQLASTNSSVKPAGKLATKKEEGTIATSKKRGSSKVAKTPEPVKDLQVAKRSVKADIQSSEVLVVEEAASAGYNSDVGTLAASAYLGGVQMRFADEVSANLPKAMSGIFGSIGEISDTRHQGIFDHVRINEPSEETAIDWSF